MTPCFSSIDLVRKLTFKPTIDIWFSVILLFYTWNIYRFSLSTRNFQHLQLYSIPLHFIYDIHASTENVLWLLIIILIPQKIIFIFEFLRLQFPCSDSFFSPLVRFSFTHAQCIDLIDLFPYVLYTISRFLSLVWWTACVRVSIFEFFSTLFFSVSLFFLSCFLILFSLL